MVSSDVAGETRRRVRPRDPMYFELVEFLDDEAATLDRGDMLSWLDMLAPDIVYRAPVRLTRERNSSPFDDRMFHFDETFATLQTKIRRMTLIPSAWAENPPSGTRRFVTGVRVHEGDSPDEWMVSSSVLLLRSRYDEDHVGLLSGRREDVIRGRDNELALARRTIYFDQATLQLQNLSLYL
jgi:3-phenylpropionate/cinnamic acid dioxygenase small subunit